jgi:inner membrane protein
MPEDSAPQTENIQKTPEAIPYTSAKTNKFSFEEPQLSPAMKRWGIRLLIVIAGLSILQLPLYLIGDLSKEREKQSVSAESAIAAGWGAKQNIGVILAGNDEPDKLEVKTALSPEIRYRGIYQTVVYIADSKINIGYEKANKAIEIGVSDLNGLTDVSAKVNGIDAVVTYHSDSVISVQIPANVTGKVNCELSLKLRGTSSFAVTANAKSNNIEISGAWSSPNLAEGILPDSRQVDDDKFSASWQIKNFARKPGEYGRAAVSLKIAAGTYQQLERVMNYATFFLIVFFFTLIVGEAVAKTDIHPLQYLIAAGAPVLFYLMLLAVGEKTGFSIAYLISAVVVVFMVTAYAKMFMRKFTPALIMGAVFAVSYAVNYFILQMEDFALLSGTVILAIVLGVVMILTGKMNQKSVE